MDSLFIEKSSITNLEQVLLRTQQIQTSIQTNDKIPSWDGELIVYKSKGKINKSNIMGNIRIQVKGTFKKDLNLKEIKYAVEKSDLEIYKTDGGCIFFVIYIKDFENFKIYYQSLLPFDLKLILDGMGENQKTKNITFIEYPVDDIKLQMKIYQSYINNRTRQMSTVNAAFSLKDLDISKLNEFSSFSFHQLGIDINDMMESAFKLPTYIYANTMNNKISIPCGKMKIEAIETGELKEALCLNGKKYFESVKIRKTEDDIELIFGNEFKCSEKNNTLNYNIKGTLNERIRDWDFLIDLCESSEKNINVGTYYSAKLDNDCSLENIEQEKINLQYMKNISSALINIGVNTELECDNLTRDDEYNIDILIQCLMFGRNITSKVKLPKIIVIDISNISFPIVTEYKSDNEYTITSLFSKENVMISNEEGNEVNAFLLMTKNEFLKFSNIDYDFIIKEVTKNACSEKVDEYATQFILQGLLAYDINNLSNLLDCILKISEWQIKYIKNDINYLNMFQIIKRKKDFESIEIEKISEIKTRNQGNCEIQLGASILLENKLEMKMYWDRMDETQREQFKKFPIFRFFNLN